MIKVIGFQETQCKDCYKCVRTCEVKAIVVKDGHAQIMDEKCVLCGHCLEICPQNAKTIISDMDKVKGFLRQGDKVAVSLAPSYRGVFKGGKPGQILSALKKLGFYQIRETSEGAAYVTQAYADLLLEEQMDNVISTCCPSVNDLIEIYYPELTRFMAPVVSPMIAHGRLIKKQLGQEVKVVFVGPCIAKKREAEGDSRVTGAIDAVLNFAEVEEWMEQEGILPDECPEILPDNPNPQVNRLYPVGDGVILSVNATLTQKDHYRRIAVQGLAGCMELLDSMRKGEIQKAFIEMNACSGGCVKGPALDRSKISRFQVRMEMEEAIPKKPVSREEYNEGEVSFEKHFYDRSSKEPLPSEEEIRKVLAQTGKTDKKQELNCGACGYSTCREKAIAVIQGKAELSMCLPYMHEKASSLSNVVLTTSPNMILIVDEDMKIAEFNKAAEKVFGKTRAQALEMYLFEFMDHTDFQYVLDTHASIIGKKMELKDWNRTVMANIVYIKEMNGVLGVLQDITQAEEKARADFRKKVDTIEIAQKVIDKQMTVAQEIAGLLGESTAEMKVTLMKMKDTILSDGEDG